MWSNKIGSVAQVIITSYVILESMNECSEGLYKKIMFIQHSQELYVNFLVGFSQWVLNSGYNGKKSQNVSLFATWNWLSSMMICTLTRRQCIVTSGTVKRGLLPA